MGQHFFRKSLLKPSEQEICLLANLEQFLRFLH
jgi:hypothetical protein